MSRSKRNSSAVETEETQRVSSGGSKVHPKGIKPLAARTTRQEEYLQSIANNVITVGFGPAGTGKTHIAVYQALKHHWSKATGMKRIIITRPAIEAGEKLGFLPGALEEKVDPYMRPIYDSLYDLIGVELTKEKIERGYIEIAPVAFLRGRTFKNSFVIVDEAQNATLEQLKMVVTRIGENCKMVINGDPGQSDLPRNKDGGLKKLVEIIRGVENTGVICFDRGDIVRSKIVVDLVEAFERYEEAHPSTNGKS